MTTRRHHQKMLAGFEREGQRSDRNLELFNTTGMRRYKLGEHVIIDSLFCPRCDCYTGQLTGRIVGFEGTSMLEDDGHVGPFYLVDDIDGINHHHRVGQLVCAQSELAALR
jgi:hypothetical protein